MSFIYFWQRNNCPATELGDLSFLVRMNALIFPSHIFPTPLDIRHTHSGTSNISFVKYYQSALEFTVEHASCANSTDSQHTVKSSIFFLKPHTSYINLNVKTGMTLLVTQQSEYSVLRQRRKLQSVYISSLHIISGIMVIPCSKF